MQLEKAGANEEMIVKVKNAVNNFFEIYLI